MHGYTRTFYSNKELWESELNPDTTFLDTLFVTQTEDDFSYYWWVKTHIQLA